MFGAAMAVAELMMVSCAVSVEICATCSYHMLSQKLDYATRGR
jgi:hypothetical protein